MAFLGDPSVSSATILISTLNYPRFKRWLLIRAQNSSQVTLYSQDNMNISVVPLKNDIYTRMYLKIVGCTISRQSPLRYVRTGILHDTSAAALESEFCTRRQQIWENSVNTCALCVCNELRRRIERKHEQWNVPSSNTSTNVYCRIAVLLPLAPTRQD